MKRIHILAVGRLKTPCWQAALEHYRKRLARTVRLDESIVKDADSSLAPASRNALEAERLLKRRRPGEILVCLDQNGEPRDSPQFADMLRRLFDAGKVPCFVIGGAYGLDATILAAADMRLSLGAMTFPHELARVLLYEQLYRAESILAGTGYHH